MSCPSTSRLRQRLEKNKQNLKSSQSARAAYEQMSDYFTSRP
jgi:hypothetical protein